MCGICGSINFDPKKGVEREPVDRMLRDLTHRGPDDEGIFADRDVAFGHRRLSIIDLSGGRQPIFSEDKTICVVVNGEIYNYRELKEELGDKHTFSTHSDSEVIIHLWEEHGVDCVSFLRGMFAFALYDRNQGAVFLARDRFGQKPLVYAETNEGLFFCSEIYPLTRIPSVDTRLCAEGLDDYFSFHYIPAPRTVYKGIKKIRPAHTLLITRKGMTGRRYWHPDPLARTTDSYPVAREKVRHLLKEAVRYRMIADVPVGAFLSGGVDSSIIVGMMRQNEPDAHIETVSIGFDEKSYDERRFAGLVADQYGTHHHAHVVRPDIFRILPDLVRHYGEPYGDPSAIPTWYLSQVTAGHVKASLSGDGGDELFAGYNRFDSTCLVERYQKLPGGLRNKIIEPLVQALPDVLWKEGYVSQLKQFMKGASKAPVERLTMRNSVFSPDLKKRLYSENLQSQLTKYQAKARFETLFDRLTGFPEIEKLYWVDLSVFLPDDILAKVDIASMAHGLEVRSPFLDHVLAEYVFSLPFRYKYKLFQRKRILKAVGEEFFHAAFMNRKKMGFRMPIGQWLRTSLKEKLYHSIFESPLFTGTPLFRRQTVQRMIDEHTTGRVNHTERLWNIWFLAEWTKEANIPAQRY